MPRTVCQRTSMYALAGWCFLIGAAAACGQETSAVLKLAFVSNREHYWYPHVYLYEHDGKSTGKVTMSIDPKDQRLDHQPVLSRDGRLCVFGLEHEGQVGGIQCWDLHANKALDQGDLLKTPNALFSPSLSADGTLLAVTAWNRPGSSARWDVLMYDLQRRQPVELPGLNTTPHDERRVAISGDGQWLAFTSNAPDGRGLSDIRIYDRATREVVNLHEMNSEATDSFPSLSADGRLVCFASDRQGGAGGLDIYLYDRVGQSFLELPGLNAPGHEQTPSITHDGRYLAFVSERFGSAGEHDIFLYDRHTSRLVATPDLNTDRDDYDPCVVLVSASGR